MNKQLTFATIVLLAWALHAQTAQAGDKPFPKIVPVLDGSFQEGFAIGVGTTAYSGSPDGSIYKVDLRSGQGEILVPAEVPFDPINDCFKLGMRVDPRTNYLFVAGCVGGNAYVFDADSGEEIANFQLTDAFAIVNDLAITKDAVYFTDSFQPFLYRLPLSRNGGLPQDSSAVIAIPLVGDFVNGEEFCCAANGIVATPDGKTLIIGHANNAQLFRVEAGTGDAVEISVSPALEFGDQAHAGGAPAESMSVCAKSCPLNSSSSPQTCAKA